MCVLSAVGKEPASDGWQLQYSSRDSYGGELVGTWWSWVKVADPFDTACYSPPTIALLWTLSFEIQGSMLAILLAVCLSRCRCGIRMGFLGFFVYLCNESGTLRFFLFINGMLLAESRHIRQSWRLCLEDVFPQMKEITIRYTRIGIKCLWVLIFILGLIFGSCPWDPQSTYGWVTLSCRQTTRVLAGSTSGSGNP